MVKTSGGSWLCLKNEAYSPKMVEWMTDRTTIDFGLYVGNPTDSIRADKYPWGWESPDYDDQKWLPAKWCDIAGGRDVQFAGGILYGGGKLLIPRRTGLLRETITPFGSIRKVTAIEKNENFIHNQGTLVIPAHKKVSMLIDQSYETMGYPEMMVSGGKDARIQAMYAENMIVENHAPKGNRNDIEGKRLVGIKDVFIADGAKIVCLSPLISGLSDTSNWILKREMNPLQLINITMQLAMLPLIERQALKQGTLQLTG